MSGNQVGIQFDTNLQFRIRSATLKDVPAIAQLISDSAREFIIPDYDEEGANTMLNSLVPQAFIENMEDGFRYWVAESNNDKSRYEIVGVIGLKPPTHLFHLFVAKSFHGRGIANTLWHTFLESVRSANPEHKRITVNASRFAIPVYQKLGFQFENGEQQSCTHRGVICYPMIYSDG